MLDLARYETIKPAPRTIFERLDERATRVRFMVPEGDDYRAVTWSRYAKTIRAIGSYLAGGFLEKGERAAIFAHNSVEWMASAMAIQSVGGTMVPVYPASTTSQAAYVARHSGARVVFVGDSDLLGRILGAFDAYEKAARIVLLDD